MMKITNYNEFNFVGRYDGKDYAFPSGEAVVCPDAAAAHIFGIGDPNKIPYLARHGWALVSGSVDAGLKILQSFEFEHIVPTFDAPPALVEYGPAPVLQGPVPETDVSDDAEVTDTASRESRKKATA